MVESALQEEDLPSGAKALKLLKRRNSLIALGQAT